MLTILSSNQCDNNLPMEVNLSVYCFMIRTSSGVSLISMAKLSRQAFTNVWPSPVSSMDSEKSELLDSDKSTESFSI